MKKALGAFAISSFLALTGASYAQDTATADQTDAKTQSDGNPMGLAMGTEADAIGTAYEKAAYGAFSLRCIRVAEGEKEPCQLFQLLKDKDGNGIAEVNFFDLPPGQQAVAGATIVTPLETLLTEQLTLSIDGGPKKRYPFSWCGASGCFSRVGFTNADITAFKRGSAAKITVVAVAAPDQPVTVTFSLDGFTKGFAALVEANK